MLEIETWKTNPVTKSFLKKLETQRDGIQRYMEGSVISKETAPSDNKRLGMLEVLRYILEDEWNVKEDEVDTSRTQSSD